MLLYIFYMNRIANKTERISAHSDHDPIQSLKEQKLQTVRYYRQFSNGKEEENKYILAAHSLDGKRCQW